MRDEKHKTGGQFVITKNIFTPIFIGCLLVLTLVNSFIGGDYSFLIPVMILLYACAVGFFILQKYKFAYVFLVFAFGLLLGIEFLKEKEIFTRTSEFSFPRDEYVTLEGELKEYPHIFEDYSVIFLKTRAVEFYEGKHVRRFEKVFNIRLKVQGNLSRYYKGDKISIDAIIYRSTGSMNFYPNGTDDLWLVNRIHFGGFCKSSELVSLVGKSSWVWRVIGGWRNAIRREIEGKYKHENRLDPRGVFLEAIVIGERGELTPEQEDEFKNSGVYHLLSISGSHIGVIVLFCLGIFKWFEISPTKQYVFTALVIVLFFAISDFQIPAERAVLMVLLIFTARVFFLDANVFNVLSFCGLVLLILNPAQFLDVGYILTFILSYGIVAGREIFIPLLMRLNVFGGGRGLIAVDGLDSGDQGKKRFSSLLELLSANFSCSLISIPLTMVYFYQATFASFISGLILVPLAGVITGLGILLIPVAAVSSSLSQVILWVSDIPMWFFFKITPFLANEVGLTVYGAPPPVAVVIGILCCFFLIAYIKWVRFKVILVGLMVLGLLFTVIKSDFFYDLTKISYFDYYYKPKQLEIFYLDVGQGDSEVVVFPGGDALLIDGGGVVLSNFEVGKKIVLPFILRQRIRVKWVAVSHYHPDHVNGISQIMGILKPEELWISSVLEDEPEIESGYRDLMKVVPKTTVIRKVISNYRRIVNGCSIEVLFPERVIYAGHSVNNHSQVIRVTDNVNGNRSFLFPGDIEKEVEGVLVEKYGKTGILRSSVLKVAHHGSSTSSSLEFLKKVSPEVAVYSYGINNSFHFPHSKTVKHFKQLKIPCLDTARRGGIQIISLRHAIKIITSK